MPPGDKKQLQYEKFKSENDHLKTKIEKMAFELEEQVNLNEKSQRDTNHAQCERKLQISNSKLETEIGKTALFEKQIQKLESEITFLERKGRHHKMLDEFILLLRK